MPVSAGELWAWHARPGAFLRLVPPWESVELISRGGGLETGAEVQLKMGLGPTSFTWVSRHVAHETGRGFIDEQQRGPFASWRHEHRFEPRGELSQLIDHLTATVPAGFAGRWAEGPIRAKLDRSFAFRHRRTSEDLTRHAKYGTGLRIAITGASGMIGTALSAFLGSGGHTVVPLVRHAPKAGELGWDPQAGTVADLSGFDAVVHLAGVNVGGGRWTEARKAEIRESRVGPTKLIATAVAKAKVPVLVIASGAGIYGDRGEETLDEFSSVGEGFLAEVASAWENAAFSNAGSARVVALRMGSVIDRHGGMLGKLLPLFQMGLGGPVGSGRAWTPWIDVDDAIGAMLHAIATPELRGPVNSVAPDHVRNADFGHTLGRVLHRPAFMPAPAPIVRGLLGEMSNLVLDSACVVPTKLRDTGFVWVRPTLETALRWQLGEVS